MTAYSRWLGAALLGAAILFALKITPAEAQANCTDTPEGPVCQVQQPLINGTLVDIPMQNNLGLVRVGNGCSGTLVNRWWVLTADHCVTNNGIIGGPLVDSMANVAITASWTARRAIPTGVVRWGPRDGRRDVALLFLGGGDLGAANIQLFYVGPVDTSQTITKYGRGIFAFATQIGPVAIPSQQDGRYRSGVFTPTSADENFITVQPNGAGQIPDGGDSGGPDVVTGPGGISLGIAGVQSTCRATGYVPKQPTNWSWATGIPLAQRAALADIRFEIMNVMAERPIASNDFNDDNLPDISWHNDVTGETQIWFMNSSSIIGRATVVDERGFLIMIGAPWRIVASRDFNRDNRTDFLWYNSASGELQVWCMNGFAIRSRATILGENGSPVFIGPPWTVVGANDMNGDGYADIVWHNDSTGETKLWLMNGTRVARAATVLAENGTPILVGLPWSIVSTDDMNKDGRPDIIWHNAASNETQIWYMNNDRILGRATVLRENAAGPAFVGLPWSIVGTNDFNRVYRADNFADLLWHNEATGETKIWFMNGATVKGSATVDAKDGGSAFVGVPWHITPH